MGAFQMRLPATRLVRAYVMSVMPDHTFGADIIDDLPKVAYALKGAEAVVNYLGVS